MKQILIVLFAVVSLTSCSSENYSNGERVGLITQFSRTGLKWKSWEGHLNMTQTGMNSSIPFDFSIDNDNEPADVIKTLDSAANLGWKVKVVYHETFNNNWWGNRGETDFFVTKCEVLDRNPVQNAFGVRDTTSHGRVIDTIYVVIVDKDKIK